MFGSPLWLFAWEKLLGLLQLGLVEGGRPLGFSILRSWRFLGPTLSAPPPCPPSGLLHTHCTVSAGSSHGGDLSLLTVLTTNP